MSGSEPKTIFILGAGRSGSTLLELILDSHSEIRGLGELNHISTFAAESARQPPQACSYCRASSCPFWNESVDWTVLRRFYSSMGFASGLRRSLSRRLANPFVWFVRWSSEPILVDSSKNLLWINRHLAQPGLWKEIEPILLFLTRDGRAVTNAVLRTHPHRTMAEAARQWKSRMLANEAFFESFRLGRRLRLSYEELVTEPADTARRLCAWLQIAYEPCMLDYWSHGHHTMAGNTSTRGRIRGFQEGTAAVLPKRSSIGNGGTRSPTRGDRGVGLTISPDERWRWELATQDLRTFDRIAGEFNRKYLPRA